MYQYNKKIRTAVGRIVRGRLKLYDPAKGFSWAHSIEDGDVRAAWIMEANLYEIETNLRPMSLEQCTNDTTKAPEIAEAQISSWLKILKAQRGDACVKWYKSLPPKQLDK